MKKNKILLTSILFLTLTGCNISTNSSATSNVSTTSISSEASDISSIVSSEEEIFDATRLNELYNSVASYMKDIKNNNSTTSFSKTHAKKNRYIESNDYDTLGSIVALIKFTANMYANPEFIVSDEMVVFVCLGASMAFYNEIDVENNKIDTSIIFPYGMEGSDFLINITVDYDFSSETIKGFVIRQTTWAEPYCNIHYKYENNIFYTYEPTNDLEKETEEGKLIQKETNSIRLALKEKEANITTISSDFTAEYEDAMEFAFNE